MEYDAIGPVTLKLLPIDALKPHENIIEDRIEGLLESLKRIGVLVKPILVDAKTMIILDGHHRVEALRRIGARMIPAILVDYDNEGLVRVSSWREGVRVTKDDVRRAGLSGNLMPPRTSRHIVSFKIPDVNIPIDVLRGVK